jgi:hypothetical protein
MTGVYLMLAGFVAFATIVCIWDYLAERSARPPRDER